MSITGYLPRFEDHFPKTRRGHGRGLGKRRPSAINPKVFHQEFMPCVDPTCQRNALKSKNLHEDKAANIADWKSERGVA